MTAVHDEATLLLDHPIGRHGRLAIRLASADIRINGEDGERATVRSPGGRPLPDRVVIEAVDGGLTIREKDALGLTFGHGRQSVELEVGVPPETDVTVDTASGSVSGRGLHGPQHYRTASGELRLVEAAGRIDVNAVSGDVEMELSGTVELAIRTVSGDVRVAGGTLDVVRVQTTSGDVRLDTPLTAKTGNTIETLSGDVSLVASGGLRVHARTVSGDLSSTLPHRSEGRPGQRMAVIGDGDVELAFRSVSGDLRIHDGSGVRSRPVEPSAPSAPPAPGAPELPPAPSIPQLPPLPPLPGLSEDRSALSRVDAISDGQAASGEPGPSVADDGRLAILRALESGELDVRTALDRLAELDAREAEVEDGGHV